MRWNDNDVRRYGYWSVFAGGCGYTYGNNGVMQMHRLMIPMATMAYTNYWYEAINTPGASQMVYIKDLMLSKSYFDRVPDQTLIAGKVGEKYERLFATRGKNYAMIYTYTGRTISVKMDKLNWKKV